MSRALRVGVGGEIREDLALARPVGNAAARAFRLSGDASRPRGGGAQGKRKKLFRIAAVLRLRDDVPSLRAVGEQLGASRFEEVRAAEHERVRARDFFHFRRLAEKDPQPVLPAARALAVRGVTHRHGKHDRRDRRDELAHRRDRHRHGAEKYVRQGKALSDEQGERREQHHRREQKETRAPALAAQLFHDGEFGVRLEGDAALLHGNEGIGSARRRRDPERTGKHERPGEQHIGAEFARDLPAVCLRGNDRIEFVRGQGVVRDAAFAHHGIVTRDHAAVAGNGVPRFEKDDVSRHDVRGGQKVDAPGADDRGHRNAGERSFFENAVGADVNRRPEKRPEDQHGDDRPRLDPFVKYCCGRRADDEQQARQFEEDRRGDLPRGGLLDLPHRIRAVFPPAASGLLRRQTAVHVRLKDAQGLFVRQEMPHIG